MRHWLGGFMALNLCPEAVCRVSIFRNVKINTIKLKRWVMNFFLSVFRLFSNWYSLGNDNSLNNGAIFLIKQWRLTSYYFSRTRGQNPRRQKKRDFKRTEVAIKWKYAPLTLSCVLVTLHGLSIHLFSRLNSFLLLDRNASLGRRENTLPVESSRRKVLVY